MSLGVKLNFERRQSAVAGDFSLAASAMADVGHLYFESIKAC